MSIRYLSGINVDANTLFVDSANDRVGIGTASPSVKLEVEGAIKLGQTSDFPTAGITHYTNGYLYVKGGASGAAMGNQTFGSSVYVPSDNTVQLVAGSSERMRITADGNVGIGTTSPSEKLTVSGNLSLDGVTRKLYFDTTGSAKQIILGVENDYQFHIVNARGNSSRFILGNTDISLGTSSVKLFYINTSTGNVGIGTTSPSYKLDVNGQIRVDNGVGNGSGQALIVGGSGDVTLSDGGSLFFGAYDYGASTYIRGYDSNDVMYFYSNGTNSVYFKSDRAIFNVNVGIGTTSPSSRLSVVNSASPYQLSLKSDTTKVWSMGVGIAGYYQDWFLLSDGSADIFRINGGYTQVTNALYVASNFRIDTNGDAYQPTTGGVALWAATANATYPSYGFYGDTGIGMYRAAADTLAFSTSDTERMRITSGGNVGIGTTSPAEILELSTTADPKIRFVDVGNTDAKIGIVGSTALGFEVNGSERMRIASTGATRLNAYGSGSFTGTVAYNLAVDSSGNVIETAGGVVDGSGTANYVSKWSDANTLTNSVIYDNGTNVGIGTTPNQGVRLQVAGAVDAWNSLNTLLRLSHDGTRGKIQSYTGGGYSPTALNADGGNVLIGTDTDAGYKLDVSGTGRFTDTLTASSTAGGTSAIFQNTGAQNSNGIELRGGTAGTSVNWKIEKDNTVGNAFQITPSTANGGTTYTTPSLTIASTGAATFSSSVTATNFLASNGGDFGWGDGTTYIDGDSSNQYIRAVVNNSEKLRITTAGNVGIGTTSPANKLVATSDASPTSENTYAIAAAAASDPAYKTVIGYDFTNDIGLIAAVRTGIGWRNISMPQGSLGLGNIAPTEKLHVTGNVRVTGAYYDSSNSAGSSGQVLSSTGSGTDWVSLSEISGVDGTGTANYVAKWSDADTIANSQIVDNGTNVGINNATPKTKLDVNGAIGFGSKTLNISDTFVTVLTVNMSNHTGCYVKITAFGDWSGHSAVAYLGEFFLQNGASAYNEPGVIIRQVDNTNTDDVVAQIVDPAGTGTRDFEIQLKTTSASGVPFSAAIQYEVRGQYNSVS